MKGALAVRNFRLLMAGESVSQFGGTATLVAIPILAVELLEVDVSSVGLLSFVSWLPVLLFAIPFGVMVDRISHRRVMVAANSASMLALVVIILLGASGHLTFVHLLACTFVVGCTLTLFETALRAYVPALVDQNLLVDANSKLLSSSRIAQIMGRGSAGSIMQFAGNFVPFLIDAVTYLVSIVCLRRIDSPERISSAQKRTQPRKSVGSYFHRVVDDDRLRAMCIFMALTNFGFVLLQALEVIFLVRDMGLTPSRVTALMSVPPVGGVLGAISAARLARRFGAERCLVSASCLVFPLAFAIPLSPANAGGIAMVAVGYFSTGTGIAIATVLVFAIAPTRILEDELGGVGGVMRLCAQGPMPIAGLVAGILGEIFGVRWALGVGALFFSLAPLLLLTSGSFRRCMSKKTRSSVEQLP